MSALFLFRVLEKILQRLIYSLTLASFDRPDVSGMSQSADVCENAIYSPVRRQEIDF